MLNFFSRRNLIGGGIPANRTVLSVSWLGNQFSAVAVQRGRVAGTWQRSDASTELGEFGAMVREAADRTGYKGDEVSLVLAHPRLVQNLADLPPVKGKALKSLIQRQAMQQNLFSGQAAWASQSASSGDGTNRVILHLFPRLLLNQLVANCRHHGLELMAVVPPSALLEHQLSQLPLEKDELALVAAETGGSTTVVVGRGDGQLLLVRTLPGTWSEESGRLAVDLNRTVLFVQQQQGATARQSVWLFGAAAADQVPAIQSRIPIPVKISPVAFTGFYWASDLPKLRPERYPNLISREMQKAPQRRVFAKVVVGSTAVLVMICLGACTYAWGQVRGQAATVRNLSAEIWRLQARLSELQKLDAELTGKEELVHLVVGTRRPPVAAWFLAYLGQAVPPELVVTNLEIRFDQDCWKVRLCGSSQPARSYNSKISVPDSITLLKSRLSGGPFRFRFTGQSGASGIPSGQAGVGVVPPVSWMNRMLGNAGGAGATTLKPLESLAAPVASFDLQATFQ